MRTQSTRCDHTYTGGCAGPAHKGLGKSEQGGGLDVAASWAAAFTELGTRARGAGREAAPGKSRAGENTVAAQGTACERGELSTPGASKKRNGKCRGALREDVALATARELWRASEACVDEGGWAHCGERCGLARRLGACVVPAVATAPHSQEKPGFGRSEEGAVGSMAGSSELPHPCAHAYGIR